MNNVLIRTFQATAILSSGIAWFGFILPFLVSFPNDLIAVFGILLTIATVLLGLFFIVQWFSKILDSPHSK